jgi:hypothetical protein
VILGTFNEEKYNVNGVIEFDNPYQLIPTATEIQLIPYDEFIIGRKIENITLPSSIVIYLETPSDELQNAYTKAVTGIELPSQSIIT